ncbi:MAG: DUF11 domain-containing protein [Gemmataceae bacterium]|nr:DUF11 domain-containing protein [Gemmataceae bacterium]
MTRHFRLATLIFLCATATAAAMPPCGPACPPPGPAPALFTRIYGPTGSKATFFQCGDAREFDTPVSIGLRPGYVYRFKLSGFERYPNLALYPTFEVIGTLKMPPPLLGANFPVPVNFTQEDIDKALNGVFITKVFVLEDPEKAPAVQTKPEQPLESEVRNEREIMAAARERGRPLLIVRFGERQATPPELAAKSVPGTMLLPGDPCLGPPAQPPAIPWACVSLYEPLLGPKPLVEECMHDGGDIGAPVGFGPDGQLHGLDPSDTVAEYVDSCGRKRIAISNRVCVCVPRFAIVRTELMPLGYDMILGVAATTVNQPPYLVAHRVPSIIAQQVQQPEAVLTRKRPSVLTETQGLIAIEQLYGTGLVIGEQGGQVVIGTCKHVAEKPPCPMVLCKTVDRKEAQIGDEVTFTLKYTNPGGQPITNVIVSDSLTARLEYVPGSAKSEREATFTVLGNEVGSQVLRWEIGETLLPGQSGTVTFQVRIR